jgi:hypothetical protein
MYMIQNSVSSRILVLWPQAQKWSDFNAARLRRLSERVIELLARKALGLLI